MANIGVNRQAWQMSEENETRDFLVKGNKYFALFTIPRHRLKPYPELFKTIDGLYHDYMTTGIEDSRTMSDITLRNIKLLLEKFIKCIVGVGEVINIERGLISRLDADSEDYCIDWDYTDEDFDGLFYIVKTCRTLKLDREHDEFPGLCKYEADESTNKLIKMAIKKLKSFEDNGSIDFGFDYNPSTQRLGGNEMIPRYIANMMTEFSDRYVRRLNQCTVLYSDTTPQYICPTEHFHKVYVIVVLRGKVEVRFSKDSSLGVDRNRDVVTAGDYLVMNGSNASRYTVEIEGVMEESKSTMIVAIFRSVK